MYMKKSTPAWSRTDVNKPLGTFFLETPLALKRLASSNDKGDFSEFQNENRGTTRRLVSVEKEVRLMKQLLDEMMTKYELLIKENKEMKSMVLKIDHIIETNKKMKKELGGIKKEN